MKLLLIILISNLSRSGERSGVSKLPEVWIPRFDVMCLQFQRLKLSAKKGLLTVFIVLPGLSHSQNLPGACVFF